ncbi:MAG TPA: hypothetical protein VD962_04210 [Rubricoccaceae bacterium]|nr:hypothetical protein [Rubricoccaceae bacterium]
MPTVNALLGYVVAAVMTAVGIGVLTGYFGGAGAPPQLRITLGIVLILFGVYRVVSTVAQERHDRERQRRRGRFR